MNGLSIFLLGMHSRPRCRIEDACNRVSRQMYRREDRQWRNGVDAGASVALVAAVVVFLIAWVVA